MKRGGILSPKEQRRFEQEGFGIAKPGIDVYKHQKELYRFYPLAHAIFRLKDSAVLFIVKTSPTDTRIEELLGAHFPALKWEDVFTIMILSLMSEECKKLFLELL